MTSEGKIDHQRTNPSQSPVQDDPTTKAAEALQSTIRDAVSQQPPPEQTNGKDANRPVATAELDDFGLPIRPKPQRKLSLSSEEFQSADEGENEGAHERKESKGGGKHSENSKGKGVESIQVDHESGDEILDSPGRSEPEMKASETLESPTDTPINAANGAEHDASTEEIGTHPTKGSSTTTAQAEPPNHVSTTTHQRTASTISADDPLTITKQRSRSDSKAEKGGVSEWSHQALAPPQEEKELEEEVAWQDMPAYGKFDEYDDHGRVLVKGAKDFEVDDLYQGKGGAAKGYTRVQIDEDAQSATSMDEHTSYLFKDKAGKDVLDDDEETRDALTQMQATKDMLTEGQRIAYVGVTRLAMYNMVKDMERIDAGKNLKKDLTICIESLQMWSQKMMVRLYAHMDIDSSEQVMIEQLAEHGIQPADMTQALMHNARVKNPMADKDLKKLPEPSSSKAEEVEDDEAPPPYDADHKDDLPAVQSPKDLGTKENINIDLRWTVLCDLFLVLISDSIYDSRSRVLLEQVAKAIEIPWLDICRFEKRVTDALEMQEQAERENWDEAEHMESRRKRALKKKYIMMGLATVGGSLVIGLSAGLLAPVIGAGLGAGFTAIGVAGTTGFLAGAGGTAIITTGSAIAGGSIAVRASNRRMGAVKTFEYRALHNNKRVNLILTVPGWMNGKVDDVRLPFSTVDPIMGDIYALHWEPEMLQSMGGTIRILATEALTQGLQQVLATTVLSAVIASLALPIWLSKLSYLIDNPWSVSQDRSDAAGLILADSIIDRHLGVRPITLVGFSLGARVVFSCLKELAKRHAYGLVQNVYVFGAPVVANQNDWLKARTVVSGRLVNGYATNDWILGYFFRATSGGIQRVSGLAPVENIPGLENVSVTHLVNGHMAYRAAMPKLLREVGWEVESDEFDEIEDPDPENHEGRQRELIQEIEDARQDAKKPEKLEKRKWWELKGKAVEKKGWETYDEKSKTGMPHKGSDRSEQVNGNILFDIDAIRKELESEHMEVKEIESTLPPMEIKLDTPVVPVIPAEEKKAGRMSMNPFASLQLAKGTDDPQGSKAPPSAKATGPVTTTKPSSSSMYDYDDGDDDYDGGANNLNNSTDNNSGAGARFEHPKTPPPAEPATPRPQVKSTNTMPAAGVGLGASRNAWLDEEDEHGGKDGEITMSFA